LSIIMNLLSILEEKKLKQVDLCNAININTSTMTNWKNRNTDPPAKYIIPICEFLGISPYFLLTGKQEDLSIDNLSEDEKRLLNMYSLLTDIEKGEILGEMKNITKGRGE
jgi:transcriptional regulator with XRE-family HTH domain